MFADVKKTLRVKLYVGGKLQLLYKSSTRQEGLMVGLLKILRHSFRATERKLETKHKRSIPRAVA